MGIHEGTCWADCCVRERIFPIALWLHSAILSGGVWRTLCSVHVFSLSLKCMETGRAWSCWLCSKQCFFLLPGLMLAHFINCNRSNIDCESSPFNVVKVLHFLPEPEHISLLDQKYCLYSSKNSSTNKFRLSSDNYCKHDVEGPLF